jgi:N-acetylmuramoyl-L-alanine amidase
MKKVGAVGLTLLLLIALWQVGSLLGEESQTVFYSGGNQQILLIDAGHGGADGGAVSQNGTVESEINLAIAQKLYQLTGLYGVPAKMIRPDENSIHDSSATTLREQKRSDLENRVALINATEGAVLISIHQNMYPKSASHGTQVFYSRTEDIQWAGETQERFRSVLQPENSRQAAQISDSVYLMSHISCPALLVECGFLSNQTEEEQLKDPGYQKQLAGVLLASYLQAPL